jgi:hypothetical protein
LKWKEKEKRKHKTFGGKEAYLGEVCNRSSIHLMI